MAQELDATLGGNYSTSASGDIVAADFDRDGDTDLAATTLGGELIVYTNDGSGIFTWVVVPASGSGHFGLGGGDVDADGDLDLVTAGELSGSVSILTNDGAGKFLATATYASVESSAIAIGDFNGDARPDLGIISSARVGVEVLLNTGPTFAPSMLFATTAVGSDVSTIDIDADGDLDLLVADGPDKSASVLAGAGDGTFSAPTTYAVASEPSSVAAGDLDQDGHLDLVVSNVLAGSVSVLLGRCLSCDRRENDGARRCIGIHGQQQ